MTWLMWQSWNIHKAQGCGTRGTLSSSYEEDVTKLHNLNLDGPKTEEVESTRG